MVEIDRLYYVKESIEAMTTSHHKQILNFLHNDNSVHLSENNNGVFINLSDLEEYMIEKLEKYIKYVNTQQIQLISVENKKNSMKTSFFNTNQKYTQEKKNKEHTISISNG